MTNRKSGKDRFNKDKRHDSDRFLSEKEVEDAMKEWKMNPSDDVKRKSLQKAMEGIKEARVKSTKRKRVTTVKRWSTSLVGVGMAAALFALVVINMDGLSPGENNQSTVPSDNGSDNNEEIPDNDPENNTNDDMDSNIPDPSDENEPDMTYPDPDREETQEITTYPEGMEDINTYHLLNVPELPFTTYIRDNFTYEPLETEYGEGVAVSQEDADFINVDIVFFADDVDEAEAIQYARDELAEGEEELPREDDEDLAAWALAGFVSSDNGMYSEMLVGVEGDYLFYIHSQYGAEAMDGWYPIKQVLLDEWVWKESGEPLDDSLDDSQDE